MRLARILGAIGRGLISAGVIVLLFVAYQLWGTGIQNAQAQNALANDFEEVTGIEVDASDEEALAALARESQEDIAEGQVFVNPPTANESDGDAADADEETPDADAVTGAGLVEGEFVGADSDLVAKVYPDAGEAFARIIIPAINVDEISVEGVSVEDLRKGPGHYRTTPNPGQAGNAAIAGHRTTYGAPFHRVDELKPGDSIFVTTAQGFFEYKVTGFDGRNEGGDLGYFIVDPSETSVLNDKPGRNTLTLTACHPKYSARQRIIVQAELVGEPVPTIPRSEADDLGAQSLATEEVNERAIGADGLDPALAEEREQVMSDEVAAADDPTVDSEGNPIDPEAATDDAEPSDVAGGSNDEADGTDPANTDSAAETEAGDTSEVAAEPDAPSSDDIELTSAQTPFNTDDQDFGEGLDGDPTKVQPAIMWGISGLFIWIAAWYMGRQLDRKWTLYFAGLIPFAMVLWFTFVNVDQALPSY